MHKVCELREQSWRESCSKLEARIAELEALVVWAAGRSLQVTGNSDGRRWFFVDTVGRHEFDGTDADLLRALRAAKGE